MSKHSISVTIRLLPIFIVCACIILVTKMSSFIGPALPPHLQRKEESSISFETSKSSEHETEQDTETNTMIGPSLPPELNQGVNHPVPLLPNPRNKRNVQASEIRPPLPDHLPTGYSEELSTENYLESQGSHVTSIPPLSRETDKGGDSSILIHDADVSDKEEDRDISQDQMYGPALPPGLRVGSTKGGQTALGMMGPCLPPAMKRSVSVDNGSSDSDTDVVGPMPAPSGTCSTTYLQEQLDDRALRMKRKLAGQDKSSGSGPMKRENWMLELPPEQAADFGLGPRQFRARTKPESGDRSVWTDTPADRLRKKPSPGDKPDADHELELRQRDKEMQHLVEKHSGKRRQESLLEVHQKEMKKKRKKEKEEGKCKERRPFDRDVDLQTNRFDEAQKKAILKKAQLLNDRFASGQSKFL